MELEEIYKKYKLWDYFALLCFGIGLITIIRGIIDIVINLLY